MLSNCKNKLDDKDLNFWGSHTKRTLRTGDVVFSLRRDFGPEMCTIAWAKMYEILTTYSLLGENESKIFNTVHLCEAPGAFICATNHYIKTKFPSRHVQWNWIANSLNPYYEGNDLTAMLDDDRFIVETIDHWCFGKDNTGNIMKKENVQMIWEKAQRMGTIQFVSADGSVSCIDNPNEQEGDTSFLHYCEMVCALGCLKKGGNFALKGFTLFEHYTVSKLYLLNCLFQKVDVFKPATSKAGNSETYIVCRNLKETLTQDFLSLLVDVLTTPDLHKNYAMIPFQSLPSSFVKQCVQCAAFFAHFQRSTIEENLFLEDKMRNRDQIEKINQERKWVEKQWQVRFPVRRLSSHELIMKQSKVDGSKQQNGRALVVGRKERSSASFNERKLAKKQKLDGENSEKEEEKEGEEKENRFWKMMKEVMGYEEGKGLGKNQQGNVEPISTQVKNNQLGLGYVSNSKDWCEEEEYYWLENTSSSPLNHLNKLLESHRLEMVEGLKVEKVTLSKFCSEVHISNLNSTRDEILNLEKDTPVEKEKGKCFQRGPCHALSKKDFVSRDCLKFIRLIHLENFIPLKEENELLFFIDFSRKGGFADFLLSTSNYKMNGWVRDTVLPQQFSAKSQTYLNESNSNLLQKADLLSLNHLSDFILEVDKVTNKNKVDLIFADCKPFPNQNKQEYEFRKYFLQQLIFSFSVLKEHGTLIFRVFDMWTRVSVGLVYFLHQCFSSIACIKPNTSCIASSEKFLFCKNFFGCPSSQVMEYLISIYNRLVALATETSNRDLVQIISPSIFAGTIFWERLVHFNDYFANREYQALVEVKNDLNKKKTKNNN